MTHAKTKRQEKGRRDRKKESGEGETEKKRAVKERQTYFLVQTQNSAGIRVAETNKPKIELHKKRTL
jgi:hypothetical protein